MDNPPFEIGLTTHKDLRGSLVPGEFGVDFPFLVKRFFFISGVPEGEMRGVHAHKECEQLLICISGSVTVHMDLGPNNLPLKFVLTRPDAAIYMPKLVWGGQSNFSSNTVLLVLASHLYDPDDYVHDYETFLQMRASR